VISTATLLLALLLPAVAVTAAPAPETEPDAGPATEQEAGDADGTVDEEAAREADARPRNADTPDVFVPTEEVSEDLSVAFPVDI
jgi:hypothetical protein